MPRLESPELTHEAAVTKPLHEGLEQEYTAADIIPHRHIDSSGATGALQGWCPWTGCGRGTESENCEEGLDDLVHQQSVAEHNIAEKSSGTM